jgi:hypothetical protein
VLTIGGKEYVRTLHVEDVADDEVRTAPPRAYPANQPLTSTTPTAW